VALACTRRDAWPVQISHVNTQVLLLLRAWSAAISLAGSTQPYSVLPTPTGSDCKLQLVMSGSEVCVVSCCVAQNIDTSEVVL
jgi:hypothetical protein